MKKQVNRGFTLIELLVVVLIIGILAAVAVPQYQKAIEKSEAVQAQVFLKSIWQASEVYHMREGKWPRKFDDLDILIASEWQGRQGWYYAQIADVRSNGVFSIELSSHPDGWFDVLMGRVAGPYAGAGWSIAGNLPSAQIQNGRKLGVINCVENTGGWFGGVRFNKNKGDYCQKIFKAGPAIKDTGSISVFALP